MIKLLNTQCAFVSGFWKTDHNVTLGLFHFIGPAYSYTHILPVHSGIISLTKLVCFSIASVADHANSQLRQWHPWRALNGRYEDEIHPSVIETSFRPSKVCLGFWLAVKLIASQNSPNVGLNLPLATHPTHPLLISATYIKVVVKKLLKIQQC